MNPIFSTAAMVWEKNRLYLGDCQRVLDRFPSGHFRLIYIDPPFNTGKTQRKDTLQMTRNGHSGRVGFGGAQYTSEVISSSSYEDSMGPRAYSAWLRQLLREASRVLTSDGSVLVHLDWHSVHEVKCNVLDHVFGKKSFLNEIIWAYDFGGRSKRFWPRKHDTILWYVKDPKNYIFNYEAIERIPYMAPDLVGPEKAKRGKTLTDVHWHTIVPTSGKEKTGYPTQKPIGLINRFVAVHSNPGDWCLDFFAGSGTFGEACALANRKFVLVDKNEEALRIQKRRLKNFSLKIIRI